MPLEYDDILSMKEVIFSGIPQTAIAQQFAVDPSTVSKICRGHLYPEIPWPNGETGGLGHSEYRKIRHERRQSEASAPLAEGSLGAHFPDTDVWAIEGSSRLLERIADLLDEGEVEFDPEEPKADDLGPNSPGPDGPGFVGAIDPIAALEKDRQNRLSSLKRQRAALDEMGQAAAKELDDEIASISVALDEIDYVDPRDQPEGVIYDGWDWDEVLAKASKVDLVKLVENSPEQFPEIIAVKKALGVILKAVPEHQWKSDNTSDLVANLAKEIVNG